MIFCCRCNGTSCGDKELNTVNAVSGPSGKKTIPGCRKDGTGTEIQSYFFLGLQIIVPGPDYQMEREMAAATAVLLSGASFIPTTMTCLSGPSYDGVSLAAAGLHSALLFWGHLVNGHCCSGFSGQFLNRRARISSGGSDTTLIHSCSCP